MTIPCPSCRVAVTVPQQRETPPPPPSANTEVMPPPLMKKAMVFLVGAISALYLFNPTAGFFEIIPDNIPIIGNLDEVMATLLLIRCLAFFGFDLSAFIDSKTGKFKRNPPK